MLQSCALVREKGLVVVGLGNRSIATGSNGGSQLFQSICNDGRKCLVVVGLGNRSIATRADVETQRQSWMEYLLGFAWWWSGWVTAR